MQRGAELSPGCISPENREKKERPFKNVSCSLIPSCLGIKADFYAVVFSSSPRKLDGRILRSESLAAFKGRCKPSNGNVNT